MPVSNEAWARGMLELALLPSREESQEQEGLRGEVYRRELQPYLTDHEWTYAVSEALQSQTWFPSIYVLSDLAKRAPSAPVRAYSGLLKAGDCLVCDGTGFESFERGGHCWVARCHRGCIPGASVIPHDFRTDAEWKADNARGLTLCKSELKRHGIDLDAPALLKL